MRKSFFFCSKSVYRLGHSCVSNVGSHSKRSRGELAHQMRVIYDLFIHGFARIFVDISALGLEFHTLSLILSSFDDHIICNLPLIL